jgi:mono/diheme cytochrome c family protein
MKTKFIWMLMTLAAMTFVFQFAVVPAAKAADDPGKTIFLDQKCNMCHAVEAAGITAKSAGKNPDLSAAGANKTADWFVKYLKKEEALDGKKHAKGFTGKDEDLQTLAKWLESLKGKK